MKTSDNILIYQHTLNHCMKKKFPVEFPIKYLFTNPEFNDNIFLINKPMFDTHTSIFVDNIDSFEMAIKMHTSDNIPLVLNLASDVTPGGGVLHGAHAQEEELFRKSNYHQATDAKLYRGKLGLDEVVYSPLVHIIKDNEYKLLPQPVQVACLAVAGLKNPSLIPGPNNILIYKNLSDANAMMEKIKMIFKVAIKHGHCDLILGALGCGVFHNPPQQVALMFEKAITMYGHYFRRIGFAILSKNPSDINYQVFASLFNS